jgi:hypothetical protein
MNIPLTWLTSVVQLVATTLTVFLQIGVKTWMFNNVPDICTAKQESQLTCPHNQVFFTASAIWYEIPRLHFHLHHADGFN